MSYDQEIQPWPLANLKRGGAILLAGLLVSFGLVGSASGDDQFAFSKGSFYQPDGATAAPAQPPMTDGKSLDLGGKSQVEASKEPGVADRDVAETDRASTGETASAIAESTAGMAGLVGEGGNLDAGGGGSGDAQVDGGAQPSPAPNATASIAPKNSFGDSSFEPANPQEAPPSQPVRGDNRPPGSNFDENDFDRPAPVTRPQKPARNNVNRKPRQRTERRQRSKPRKRTRQRRRGQRQARSRRKGWICRASSSTGSWGWGAHRSRRSANRRALLECAIRTPRNRVCYSRGCRAVY